MQGALAHAVARVTWVTAAKRAQAVNTGLRLMLVAGYQRLDAITEGDIQALAGRRAEGGDVLDAALCHAGVFSRTPQRGTTRHGRRARQSPAELVASSDIPLPFRAVTVQYLETYAVRISDVYATLRHKLIALGHFWRYLGAAHPTVQRCAAVRPQHARAFVPYAMERARRVRRRGGGEDDCTTAHAWVTDVRTFFADLCTWATEEDSPFAAEAPPMIPLTRHDLIGVGFEQIRRRQAARMTATVLDLEREMPHIRANALRQWQERAAAAAAATPASTGDQRRATMAFWDWALLELLVQSGLRIEEACELTTLDILKRRMPDQRIYYLLHVKPSKFDRARVIPIGDGLGRVLAEIIRQVKQFYGSNAVPPCDH